MKSWMRSSERYRTEGGIDDDGSGWTGQARGPSVRDRKALHIAMTMTNAPAHAYLTR